MFLQHWRRELVALGSLQTQPPPPPPPFFSLVSGSSSAIGVASLNGFVAALFLFIALSTSSPCARVLRTPVRVRGEAIDYFSSISLNVTPPLMHGRVIKVGWGIFPENLFSAQSRMDCSTIFPTIRQYTLTSAYKSMERSCLTIETCFEGVITDLKKYNHTLFALVKSPLSMRAFLMVLVLCHYPIPFVSSLTISSNLRLY